MSRRYTYSRTIRTAEGEETFTADQFDSFDEAKKVVDRGIHDRKLELSEKYPIGAIPPNNQAHGPMPAPATPSTSTGGGAPSSTTPPVDVLREHMGPHFDKPGIIPADKFNIVGEEEVDNLAMAKFIAEVLEKEGGR